jgi:ectoine hydroxylase-related dioxygenase (phytanoyl-CoA dioxygenase family)
MQISHPAIEECLVGYQRDGYAVVRQLFGSDAGDVLNARLNERIVRITQELLGEAAYLHSSEVLPESGAWDWRQDYGYWYTTGCLAPTLASCIIAVDGATQDNGCLQVLRGSHKLGRLDHEWSGEHFIADPARVKAAIDTFERRVITLAPGDALFVHCNLLHCLEASRSTSGRRIVICSYNTERNRPLRVAAISAMRTLERAVSELGLGHFATDVPLGQR